MPTRVKSSEVAKNFGRYQQEALFAPVYVQKYQRDSVVIVRAEEFERLKKLDRRRVTVEQLTDTEADLLLADGMDPRHDHLNALMD